MITPFKRQADDGLESHVEQIIHLKLRDAIAKWEWRPRSVRRRAQDKYQWRYN